MLRPVVSKLSDADKDVEYFYVDVDRTPQLASQFGVRSIPTLVQIKNGRETARRVGYAPEAEVKRFAHS